MNRYPVPENRIHVFSRHLKEEDHNPEYPIIDLTIGQPNEASPASVAKGMRLESERQPCRYSEPEGRLDLREAICEMLRREGGIDCESSEVIATEGTRPLIVHLLKGLCGKDGFVTLAEPTWSGYVEEIAALGLPYDIAPCGENCKMDPTKVINMKRKSLYNKDAIDTKAIILNWPNNPSGECARREDLELILESATKDGIGVILDLAYQRYAPMELQREIWGLIAEHKQDNLIPLFSFSKSLAICGLRAGCGLIRDKSLYSDVRGMCANEYTCPNVAGQ